MRKGRKGKTAAKEPAGGVEEADGSHRSGSSRQSGSVVAEIYGLEAFDVSFDMCSVNVPGKFPNENLHHTHWSLKGSIKGKSKQPPGNQYTLVVE